MTSCERLTENFPPRRDAFVIARHNDPIVDEPHSYPGIVIDITKSAKRSLIHRLWNLVGNREPAFDITVKTENLGVVCISNVTKKNYTLILEPSHLHSF